MDWKLTKRKKATLVIIGVTIAVYLGMKYLLPFVIPFFIALFLARFMQPLIRKIRKKIKINGGLLAGIFPVSYTHLDVDKRQVLWDAVKYNI